MPRTSCNPQQTGQVLRIGVLCWEIKDLVHLFIVWYVLRIRGAYPFDGIAILELVDMILDGVHICSTSEHHPWTFWVGEPRIHYSMTAILTDQGFISSLTYTT